VKGKTTMRVVATSYDPKADAERRWPHWHIAAIDLPGLGEDADLEQQIIAIEPVPTSRHAIAHALAHLDLGHHETPGREFTAEECDDADALAVLRLDEPHLSSLMAVLAGAPSLLAVMAVLPPLVRAANMLT
jgi:hypothetical protein